MLLSVRDVFACNALALTSLLGALECGCGLVDLSELVGDVLRDVVVDEGVGRVEVGLERCVV